MPALSRYSNRRSVGEEAAVPAGSPLTVYSAVFNVVVTAASFTVSEKGSGCVAASSVATSSRGSFF